MSRGWLLHWVLLACAVWGTAAAEVGAAKHTRDWRHLAKSVLATEPPPPRAPPPPLSPGTGQGEGRWEECTTCERCLTGDPPPGLTLTPGEEGHCTRCYGCSVILERLPAHDVVLGRERVVFTGASGAAVLRGLLRDGRRVIIKFWCGLPGGYKQNTLANPIEPCPKPPRVKCPLKGGLFKEKECNFRFLNSMQRMVDDANLSSVTPRTWTEVARTFLPWDGSVTAGLKVEEQGQFYDMAPGVSIEAFLGGFVNDEALSLLSRIEAESVRLAAAFDFIFSESDRHGQNVFLTPDGRMQLIDNEGTGQKMVNSMFLPGTQKYEIYRLGYGAVCCKNLPGEYAVNCPGTVLTSSPEALLDYRCHVPGGVFGNKLPPGLAKFVGHVAHISAEELQQEYDMTRLEHAQRLKQRVDDIAAFGFEGALARQLAKQPKGDGELYGQGFSYPIAAPCCDVETCPFRLSAAYHGPLRTPGRERIVPWTEEGYNAKVPKNAVVVGKRADPPLHTWGPDFLETLANTTPCLAPSGSCERGGNQTGAGSAVPRRASR